MRNQSVAYFTMEIALERGMPTYSGGLGALAGDTVRSAADLRLPMVVVSLLHRKGYFYQRLDSEGWQHEEPVEWIVEDYLEEMPARVRVQIEGRDVYVRAWTYHARGIDGHIVPVYLLDTDLEENEEWDRTLTNFLYGGDQYYRFCQEVVLGMGGVRMLRALGHDKIIRFHMNEGHASLLTLELLAERRAISGAERITEQDIAQVRKQCIFTTHTPVESGHDKFPLDMVSSVLGLSETFLCEDHRFCFDGMLNMTYLALDLSYYVNGVAKKHGEVSRHMFAGYAIDAITNGVHAGTWVSQPFADLFDEHIPGWQKDNFSLRSALSVPREAIWEAHLAAKRELMEFVNRETNAGMDVHCFTMGFARRAAPYKRGDLLLHDLDRLEAIAAEVGPLQVIFAGKAHPQNDAGKEIIQRIFKARERLQGSVRITYVENYGLAVAKLMTSGVDVWLNTPLPPFEASGTSGMKSAVNGVPSLSVLDGWWIEGHIEGVTGWAIGDETTADNQEEAWVRDANHLYHQLEHVIMPMFSGDRDAFIDIMRNCIALNGSFFNTQRMLQEYVLKAYFR